MQALILAAGMGTRLKPLTDSVPKCLTEINGTPLIFNALDCLAESGKIDSAVIVVGYLADKIRAAVGSEWRGMKITYVENEIFASTNNVYSFYLAKPFITDDCVMLECDLFYRASLLEKIIAENAACNILVSPYNAKTMDGTVIFADENGKAKSLVIGKRQGEGFDYSGALKTVNIYRFNKEFITERLFPAVELYVKTQSVNSYYELVLGSLIYYGNDDIRVTVTDESTWCEVDDLHDLEIAERVFAK